MVARKRLSATLYVHCFSCNLPTVGGDSYILMRISISMWGELIF